MRVPEWSSQMLQWRWLPFFLPVAFTLFFVAAAVLLVPDSLGEAGEPGDAAAMESRRASGFSRSAESQAPALSDRAGGLASRVSRTSTSARMNLPQSVRGAAHRVSSRTAYADPSVLDEPPPDDEPSDGADDEAPVD